MSDYIDTVDIEGVQYGIQDTPTKEQTEENTQDIQNIEPIDLVQIGNMKPPTSNAVALALRDISTIKQVRVRFVSVPVTAKIASNLSAFGVDVVTPSIPSGWNKLLLIPLHFNASNAACLSVTVKNDLTPNQNVIIYGIAVGDSPTVTGVTFLLAEYQ